LLQASSKSRADVEKVFPIKSLLSSIGAGLGNSRQFGRIRRDLVAGRRQGK
jgi:hypothetical protein